MPGIAKGASIEDYSAWMEKQEKKDYKLAYFDSATGKLKFVLDD